MFKTQTSTDSMFRGLQKGHQTETIQFAWFFNGKLIGIYTIHYESYAFYETKQWHMARFLKGNPWKLQYVCIEMILPE